MKRFQYWGKENGKPVKKWTDWYGYESDLRPKYQFGKSLANEYKE